MSVKRIGEAITASPLSDEDIESLVQQLVQKKEENSEWQGVGHLCVLMGRGGGSNLKILPFQTAPGQENAQSLKKQHQTLLAQHAECWLRVVTILGSL